MSGYYSTLNDLPTDDYCSRHDCHTRRDKDFLFWMYKLPLSLKHTFVSHTLSNLPEISRKRGNKFGVIHTLPSAIIPGMIARLVEQVSSNEHPLTLRRDAFLSLTIIVDLHSEVILAEDLLSTIFQGVLNVQYSTDIEEMDPLTLEDICSDLPVIEAFEFIHHASQMFPVIEVVGQLYKVFLEYIKSTSPLRRFYGLMTFVVATGPCAAQLIPLSTKVLDEIATSYHNQCPLVDFSLSMLISSWRCRRPLFQRCISLRASLIPIFVSSIHRHRSTVRGSDIIWAATSSLGLGALLEFTPKPFFHLESSVSCLLILIKQLLRNDHGQPIQVIELPIGSLGCIAISTGSNFSPYLKASMEMLQEISSTIPLSSSEAIHWSVAAVIGDCIKAVGRAIEPYHAFSVERIFSLGDSTYPLLRIMAFRVLAGLTVACPGILSSCMGELISMLLNSIRRSIPNVQSLKEDTLMTGEITQALSSINHLATTASILFKFVGAVCCLNMSLLGHQEIAVRIEACDCLLNQVLWDHVARHPRIQGAFRHYVAYHLRRLDRGAYIGSDARLDSYRSVKIAKALAFVQTSPQPLIKIHPVSHAPGEIFLSRFE